jgi:hypothetical protein
VILGASLGEVAVSHQTVTTVSGAEVRLYEDVLDRIFRKHGELRGMVTLITDTVASPDLVLAGHGRELVAVKHYVRTPLGAKNMVVVYREDKHLIITAFLTSDRSKLVRKRTAIWQRQSK